MSKVRSVIEVIMKGLEYFPHVIKDTEGLMTRLLQKVEFQQNKISLFGKDCLIPRKEAWFGDFPYHYSGHTLPAQEWIEPLITLKRQVEQLVSAHFNGCLINFYRDGSDYASWHRDNERELVESHPIAVVSLGATRRFMIRNVHDHKKKEIFDLASGDIIVMGGVYLKDWEHQLAKTKKITDQRMSLSFRKLKNSR